MHATEHSDRFTVVLPNGQPMDVFKADLRPETAAELRSMVVPAMATRGDVTGAEPDAIEEQAKELEDGGWAPMVTYDPKAERAARYGAGDERDAGTLADGLSLDGSVPVPAGDTYVSETPDALAARERAARLAAIPSPRDTYLARNSALNAVADELTAVVGDLPMRTPGPIDVPSIPSSEPGTPAMPLAELSTMPDMGDGIPSMQPEFYKPLPVMGRGELAKLEGERRMLERGRALGPDGRPTGNYNVPPDAPAAPPAPPVDPDAEMKSKFSQFMQSAEEGKPFTPVSVGAATPFDATGINNAFDAAQKANKDVADFDMKAGALREQREIDAELKKRAMNDRHAAERISEQRRLDQMREDAYNGKIDVNRAFDRMDNGQRALSLIGLILGGIGAGNTGVNAALGVMERMIDRDIDAQAKDLGRKQTAYSNAIQQGYQAEQARQVAKAEAFSLLDGAIARAAAKSNSDRAMLNAQALNAELGVKRENTLTNARHAHEARDGQRLDRQLRADGMNLELQLKREANEIARKSAVLKAMFDPKIEALKHTLPNGTTVIASDPTAKAKLAEAQSAFVSLSGLITDAKANRAKDGRGINPWGATVKDAEAVQGLILGQLNRMLALGALDVRTMEMLKGMIPRTSDILSNDEGVYASLDRILSTVQNNFLSNVTANTRGGVVYGFSPTQIEAE